MGTQGEVERELNLVEVFWNILFGWRQVICFGIVVAVLLGGMKYVKDLGNYRTVENVNMKQEGSELSEDEMQQVLEAGGLMMRIKEYEDYLENSALMQINLYAKPVVELQYYVDSDYTFNYTQESQNDYTDDLMTLYYNYIMSGEMSEKVIDAAKLSVDQAEFSELWSVSQVGNSISVKIACPEEEKMEAVAESIKSQLTKKEEEFQGIGSHKLKLLGESQNKVVDNGLIDRKNTISNNIATLSTQLGNLKKDMTEQQLGVLNSDEEEMEDTDISGTKRPRFSLKYMMLGAVLGIFLVCIWIVCKMLFTVKLQDPEEIRTFYNTRLLGEITIEPEKKRFLYVIDERLLAIKNRKRKKLTIVQQIKILSANIALSCKQQGIDCIYMTGSEYENTDVAALDMLKKKLCEQNIRIKEGGNIFYDAESLKQGTEIGNILFVEQKGKSIYNEISNELNLAREQNNHILGVVVLV